jgi:choline kinase
MKCVIIAAGQGSRLRSLAPSKPLADVAGRPLIDHVLSRAQAGGATQFVVVTGYEAEGVEDWLAASAFPATVVRNEAWDRPNGLSVAAAAEAVAGEEFLLLMSDHLFDPAILAALVALPEGPALTLAVDYAIDNPLIDLDDATKVDVAEDGRIRRLGKTIEGWNAIDAGAFRATPALFEAIRASIAAGGQGSLSEGVQRLADAGAARVMDIEGRWWTDVDDPRAHAVAEAYLRDQAR